MIFTEDSTKEERWAAFFQLLSAIVGIFLLFVPSDDKDSSKKSSISGFEGFEGFNGYED